MSTIKVNKIENTSTTNGGISIDNSGDVQMSGKVQISGQPMPSAGPLSNRNLVINGGMQVAQRATQATNLTTGNYYTSDRFYDNIASLGTWTSDHSTDAPNGFSRSHKMTCTTADASPGAGDYLLITYQIEAQNLQHLKFGTSAAESLTLSFYVKSNKTGSASLDMHQPDASNRLISTSYTINSANTWEYKTITFPGDTSGVINNDTGSGLVIDWWMNSGSGYSSGSHQTSWGALDQTARNASNLGVGGAVSDYFAITGIQLEVGSAATPFEHRSYGDELPKCQRYYFKAGASDGLLVRTMNDGSVLRTIYVPHYLPVPVRDHTTASVVVTGDNTDSSGFTSWNYMAFPSPTNLLFAKANIQAGGWVDTRQVVVNNEL